MRNENLQALKTSVDRLHATTLIRVGDLASDTFFVFQLRIRRHTGTDTARTRTEIDINSKQIINEKEMWAVSLYHSSCTSTVCQRILKIEAVMTCASRSPLVLLFSHLSNLCSVYANRTNIARLNTRRCTRAYGHIRVSYSNSVQNERTNERRNERTFSFCWPLAKHHSTHARTFIERERDRTTEQCRSNLPNVTIAVGMIRW